MASSKVQEMDHLHFDEILSFLISSPKAFHQVIYLNYKILQYAGFLLAINQSGIEFDLSGVKLP